MPRAGPRKVARYSDEFKLTAVRLSQQPGIQVQTVAAALEIHPFMLSKWRQEVKDGRLRGRPGRRRIPLLCCSLVRQRNGHHQCLAVSLWLILAPTQLR
jgi:Transposase.